MRPNGATSLEGSLTIGLRSYKASVRSVRLLYMTFIEMQIGPRADARGPRFILFLHLPAQEEEPEAHHR